MAHKYSIISSPVWNKFSRADMRTSRRHVPEERTARSRGSGSAVSGPEMLSCRFMKTSSRCTRLQQQQQQQAGEVPAPSRSPAPGRARGVEDSALNSFGTKPSPGKSGRSGGAAVARRTAGNGSAGSKSSYRHVPHSEKPPHLVARRNARERRRVQAVNNAFIRLRRHVPYEPRHKRLSKVKTLRIAIDYIRGMQTMIQEYDQRLQRSKYHRVDLPELGPPPNCIPWLPEQGVHCGKEPYVSEAMAVFGRPPPYYQS